MAQTNSKFRNIIFCEDIRDEVGNKRSLMGVVAGDLLVATFPAVVQTAVYFEYAAEKRDGENLSIEFRMLQDDAEIGKGRMEANISHNKQAIFVLPRGYIQFNKPATFRIVGSVNGAPEQEIMSKRILQMPTS